MSAQPTATDVRGWADEVSGVGERLSGPFARSEPRRRALAYLRGLPSDAERKNGRQHAEEAGDRRRTASSTCSAEPTGTQTGSGTTCRPTAASTRATPQAS